MKCVFFDIDLTLWDEYRIIPDSTKEAIRRLKGNEIYTFLCSGRTSAFIKNPELLNLEFDGMVAGCGTQVEFRGEEIVYKTIAPKIVKKVLEIVKKYDMPTILEGKQYRYLDEADFMESPHQHILQKQEQAYVQSISGNNMKWEISKFTSYIKNDDYRKAVEALGAWFDVVVYGNNYAECTPKGFSKATGIQAVCERLGIAREDTYAFGDSINDLEMLKYVAHGIAMGNGMQEAKHVADYVTDDIHANGIYNACRHFQLI